MASIRKEACEGQIVMRHVVTMKVSLRVTADGHEVRVPMIFLVWQKSQCATAALSMKTTIKSNLAVSLIMIKLLIHIQYLSNRAGAIT